MGTLKKKTTTGRDGGFPWEKCLLQHLLPEASDLPPDGFPQAAHPTFPFLLDESLFCAHTDTQSAAGHHVLQNFLSSYFVPNPFLRLAPEILNFASCRDQNNFTKS